MDAAEAACAKSIVAGHAFTLDSHQSVSHVPLYAKVPPSCQVQFCWISCTEICTYSLISVHILYQNACAYCLGFTLDLAASPGGNLLTGNGQTATHCEDDAVSKSRA